MAKFAKKILINQIKNYGKEKNMELAPAAGGNITCKAFSTKEVRKAIQAERQTNYISVEGLQKLIDIARGHALWLHMMVLKDSFRLSSRQLLIYRQELQSVYRYAMDDTSGGGFMDIVDYTVHGSPKEDAGSFGYTDYDLERFDDSGQIMGSIISQYTGRAALLRYKKLKRTFYEFQRAEVASMLVLHDYFGFRLRRLRKFISLLRINYGTGIDHHLDKMAYLEKLCKTRFEEFDPIRHGKGIFDT